MEQSGSGGSVFARVVSPFINGIKRVVTDIGIFTDRQAYRDEIARYEGDLRHNTQYDSPHAENEPQLKINADEREAVTS